MGNLDLAMIAPPAEEPVTLEAAKQHCRVDHDNEDGLIEGMIAAARAHVEDVTGRALVERTLEVRLDRWPAKLYLPYAPAMSVTNVTAVDSTGVETLLDASAYALRTGTAPGYVLFDSSRRPAIELAPYAGVRVRYVAGYGGASDVPQPLVHGMLLLIGHWYTNREAVMPTSRLNLVALPYAVESLLAPYRVFWFGEWAQ